MGAANYKNNTAIKPTTKSGKANGDYYFNNKGELVQVLYSNYTHLNQRSLYATSTISYENGCGPVSALMAANMQGRLKQYVGDYYNKNRYTASAAFRNFMNTFIKVSGDKKIGRADGEGVYSTEIEKVLNKHSVTAVHKNELNPYNSSLREYLTYGKVSIVSFEYFQGHFMVVNGWRINSGQLQYNIVDPWGVNTSPSAKGDSDGWHTATHLKNISEKKNGVIVFVNVGDFIKIL